MNFTDNRDTAGRVYARLADLKSGDVVEVDAGFDCMDMGTHPIVDDGAGLAIPCACGHHDLDGQLNDNGYLVGVYGPIQGVLDELPYETD